MLFRKRQRNRNIAAFEVTPLVDIIFLIQIFFLLTLGSPLKISEVNLPTAKSGNAVTKEVITVAISQKGLLINGIYSQESELRTLPADRDIVILAPKDIPYIKVIGLLDILKTSGHERISLATKPLKG